MRLKTRAVGARCKEGLGTPAELLEVIEGRQPRNVLDLVSPWPDNNELSRPHEAEPSKRRHARVRLDSHVLSC